MTDALLSQIASAILGALAVGGWALAGWLAFCRYASTNEEAQRRWGVPPTKRSGK